MKSLFQVWVLSVAVLFVSPAYAFGYTIDDAIKAYEEKDYEQAFELFMNFAETGNADAQRNLGWMYEYGLGVTQDNSQAVAWYRKAAEQGDAVAQTLLDLMYCRSFQCVTQNDSQAATWFRKAVEQENVVTQRFLGKAAEQGDANAQKNLGFMYENGRGVEQDDVKAVAWYRKSAEQGNASGQAALGAMYLVGRGVEQNFDEALKLITQAAAKNEDSEIQSILKIVAQRGVLESPLTLRTAGKNRILDRGTYVIALLDEKRMLHPYKGTFSTEINLREGDTIKVQTQHDENNVTSKTDEDLPLNLELTTDFLIKELRLDGAPIPLSEVKPNDDPQLIQTTASVLVSPSHLTNGAILSVISRAGRESRLNLTWRDGQFTVATPADMGL